MADEIVEKKRKPKRSQLMKQVRWVKGKLYAGIIPTFRLVIGVPYYFCDHFVVCSYGIIPAMLAYSIWYTEPTPTFWELVNPLF